MTQDKSLTVAVKLYSGSVCEKTGLVHVIILVQLLIMAHLTISMGTGLHNRRHRGTMTDVEGTEYRKLRLYKETYNQTYGAGFILTLVGPDLLTDRAFAVRAPGRLWNDLYEQIREEIPFLKSCCLGFAEFALLS